MLRNKKAEKEAKTIERQMQFHKYQKQYMETIKAENTEKRKKDLPGKINKNEKN